jgi:hypothetical protein
MKRKMLLMSFALLFCLGSLQAGSSCGGGYHQEDGEKTEEKTP